MAYTPPHIKESKKGLLHRETGTPMGEKIPLSKLMAAKHSKSAAKRKRANFALVAGHEWNHSKKK